MAPELLDDSILGEYEKILSYGGFGTGKTFSAGTMPGRIYFLVIGGKNELKTLRSPDFVNKYPEKNGMIALDWVKENLGLRGTFKEAEAYDLACDKLDEALALDAKGDMPFDSLVIDAATGLRGVAMNKAIEITYDMASGKDKSALTRLRKEGILIPGDNDWGSEQSLIWKFINWCYELDKHFLLITHEWIDAKTDLGSKTTTVLHRRPLFTGKHRQEIPQMFDNVWRFSVSGGGKSRQFEAQTVGDDITDAKTRVGGVLDINMRDVNYEKCIEQMKDWKELLKRREEMRAKKKK